MSVSFQDKNGKELFNTANAGGSVDLFNYPTRTEMNSAIQDAVANVGGGGESILVDEVRATSANLFDNDFDVGGYINNATGEIITPNTRYSAATKFYLIPWDDFESDVLTIRKEDTTANLYMAFYDKDKNFIEYWGSANASESKQITREYCYFRCHKTATVTGRFYVSLVAPSGDVDYDFEGTVAKVVPNDKLPYSAAQKDRLFNPLQHRKCVNLGDSIFGMFSGASSISGQLAKLSGMEVVNGGFGGSRASCSRDLADVFGACWNNFDGCSIIDAICTGDWTAQEANMNNTTHGVPTYFPQRVADLKAVDWNAVDLITFAWGTNDYTAEVLVDDSEAGYDKTTIIGALKYNVKRIQETYPHIKILVITPIWRYFNDNGYDDCEHRDNDGIGNLRQIKDKIVDACRTMRIPALDSYDNLSIGWYNKSTYMADMTHLNENGRRMYAELIDGKIRTLY